MNLILEKSERVSYFTNISQMLVALGVRAVDYDWHVSDVETNFHVTELCSDGQWVKGGELAAILARDGLQFIWAVFSAVPHGSRPKLLVKPYADGNSSYWSADRVSTQVPGALFEIVCWDSSATILIGLSKQQETSFRESYPEAKLLAEAGANGSESIQVNAAS